MGSYRIICALAVCLCITSGCQNMKNIDVIVHKLPPFLIGEKNTSSTKGGSTQTQFDGLLEHGITELVLKCQQACNNIQWSKNLKYNDEDDKVIEQLSENKTIFEFPISVEIGKKIRDHFQNDSTIHVIPQKVKSNWLIIVDIERCRKELSAEIFRIIWKQSPIFPMMLLLAANAGVVLWVLEARQNSNEFSSSFFRGTFDGFWWAFISMTTVGYGDKTPRTTIGRVFGMIWITLGIVIVAFFTATIASTITIATVEKSCHALQNRNVAILSNNTKLKDYAKEQGTKNITEFNSFSVMYDSWQDKKENINSLFVEEHIALIYFQGEDSRSKTKNVRVTKVVEQPGYQTLFYSVLKEPSSSLPCGLNEMILEKNFPSASAFHIPTGLYTTSFKEEVDQPLSLGSPETKPILITLSACFGILAVSGYIGITIVNCLKRRKKNPDIGDLRVSSHGMESVSSSTRQIVQLEQSLNLIAQEIKEMRDILDSGK